MNAELQLKEGKNLSSKRWKSLNIFPNFKKINFIFLLKWSILIKNNLKNCPILPFLISLLRSRLQNFRNWLLQCCWLLLETSWLYSRSDHVYLCTNLWFDDSVIYSLMFCYIRYYTNIKNLEFSNSRMISSTRLSMIFARHFSLLMAPERHARTLTESAEDSLSRDLHLIIITNWESRRALEL